MEMDNKEFCYHLEQWKERHKKKDIDFCKLIDIHPNTLVNWKKGKSTPQADKMNRICEEFRINEMDLSPISFFTANDIENKLYYHMQQLRRYAKKKGLDNDFYKWLISKPYFLKEFPFSSTLDRFYWLDCPVELAEDEEFRTKLKAYPLSKFEFQDAYGSIITLSEKDIDFLVTLQRKSEQLLRNEMCIEMHRKEEQRIRNLVARIASEYLEDDKEIDTDKLYENLTEVDFSQRVLTGSLIWDRFDEYSKIHNIKMKPLREMMINEIKRKHQLMSEDEREEWKQHYIRSGMTEKEAEEQLKKRDDLRQRLLDIRLEVFKEEESNNGEH